MTLFKERLEPWTTPGWWSAYQERLKGLSPTARKVLEADCRYIVDRGVLGAGPAGDDAWTDSRVRRGLVMGAVQSGKTASLLGVAAMSIDSGVDVVVVLGGTRVSLWRQTVERLEQALQPASGSGLRWVLRPQPGPDEDVSSAPLPSLYGVGLSASKQSLVRGRPVVLVAMKQVDHLRALGRTLRDDIAEASRRLNKNIHVLVLDDEADDGSILDARAEAGLDPALAHLKQVPRHIVDLWDSRPHGGATLSERVFVTYIGYTATPQANFLQSLQNPLAPSEFVVALRTPLDVGPLDPRDACFAEPQGPSKYYSGGELFYRRLRSAELCKPLVPHNAEDDLGDAIRSYLVAGAIRSLRALVGGSKTGATADVLQTRAEALKASPEPHSMLIHPSATVESHFEAAAEVLAWLAGSSKQEARAQLDAGDWTLGSAGVHADLAAHPERWSGWLESYRKSAAEVRKELGWLTPPSVPETWSEVQAHLLEHLLPRVRLSVVNSDPRSDDRPQFEPWEGSDGWHLARDLCTIFVSGNVMARGLTLEGLTTTLFLRSTRDPYADTQMQMQRWFGYRGTYLHLCRVFLPSEQYALFSAYHDNDEALRRDIITAMNAETVVRPQVLQGRAFVATGKITNLANQPLFPGLDPVVQLLGSSDRTDPNLGLVARMFAEPSREIRAGHRLQGRLLERELSLLEAAELLDGLEYEEYMPGTAGWFGSHWLAVERQVGIGSADGAHHPLYRPPGGTGPDQSPERGQCPYTIAAYLRLWDACLSRHARGLFPTDQPGVQWSLVDLKAKQAEAPRFRVGLRFGSGDPVKEPDIEGLGFAVPGMKRATKDGYLDAEWGARTRDEKGGYRGDQSFDLPPGSSDGRRRGPGSPGLILLQIIERSPGHPSVAVGLILPLGGPDHFAARITDNA